MPRPGTSTATATALLFGFCSVYALPLRAADPATAAEVVATEEPLEEVVIIGSLLPRARTETAVTTTTLTAEDLQARGYTTRGGRPATERLFDRQRAGRPIYRQLHRRRTNSEPVRPVAELHQVPGRRPADVRLPCACTTAAIRSRTSAEFPRRSSTTSTSCRAANRHFTALTRSPAS